jgi:hypothetical protein
MQKEWHTATKPLKDSTVSEDAGIEPRTVVTLTLTVRLRNKNAYVIKMSYL